MVDDALAERLAFLGVGGGLVERCLCDTGGNGGDAEAARIQRAERDGQPLAFGADTAVGGDERVVVMCCGGGNRVQAHLLLGFAEAQALGSVGHEEARDALRTGVRGTREERVEIGLATVGDPRLRSGDAVSTVDRGRPAREGGGIRSGLRLGQAVCADGVAAEHVRKPRVLLFVGAVGGQGETGEAVHAHRDRDRSPPGSEFFEDLEVDLVGLVAAAELLGVRQAQQSGRTECREHTLRERLGALVLVDARGQDLVGDVAGQLDQVVGLLGGQKTLDSHRIPPSENSTENDTAVLS